jgi:phage terminase large subunit-like protein
MTSPSAAASALLDAPLPPGSESPRICTFPPSIDTSGDEIADFAARYGLNLLPWQRNVLRTAMGERPDGRWASGEVGLVVPRQNGKGVILEARELAGLFLLGEFSIVHTAQQFRTATDAFKRIRGIVESNPDLNRRVKKILNAPVEKSIELKSGAKLWFIARGPNAGRGLTTTDCLIFDEAYDLTDAELEALAPTMTVAPNPQVWYTSSAGLAHSVALAQVRQRGIEGSKTLAYMEWSVPQPMPGAPLPDPTDPQLLAMSNPSLGLLVTPEYLEVERGMFANNLRGLARERLGVFDEVLGNEPPPITQAQWDAQEDDESAPASPYSVAFAVAVAQDRSWACIASGAPRADGQRHVEIVENRRGTAWVVERIAELVEKWVPCAVVVNPAGPEGSLIADLTDRGIRVVQPTARDLGQAFGMFFDGIVVEKTLRHRPDPLLARALDGARARQLQDAKTWDQRGSTDISPLVAATNALWGFEVHGAAGSPNIW